MNKYIQMKKIVSKNLSGFAAAFLLSCMTLILQGQTTSTGEMPQYLFREFTKCDILMKTGQINTTVMNYNIVTGKMVFLSNNQYYDLTNPEAVDSVMLNGCKFIPVGKSFYEVLVAKPIALFIEHKGNLLTAGKPVGYGGTSQVSASTQISSIELSGIYTNLPLPKDYIVNPATVYWIRREDTWSDFTNEKQFLNLFPDKSAQIKSFIKENRIKIDKPENLTRLVKYVATF
jgi:hypothetical protein